MTLFTKWLKLGLIAFILLMGLSQTQAQDSSKAVAILNHQALFVMDLKKAADFYKNIIGLPQIEEPFKIGKHVWLKTGPHTSLHLILGADQKRNTIKTIISALAFHP
ncbi:VOC family protein [Niabella hibiscisoli]|uniref:VOC family protein n=1 Tax=Niabella hibiscisoli TaxID=1825928 RepID=UPI001F118001|nr:VOC family protein [Niabella hibiscisoli]MCH5717380.1 VOC family protein [Niabella hibiscisoli]